MTYSATGSEGLLPADARRQNAVSLLFFLLIAVAFLIRFTISPQIMDRIVHYNEDPGPIWEKIHLGTYAILFCVPLVLFTRPVFLAGDEIGKFRALLRYTLLMIGLVAFLVLLGRSGNIGIYIDTYIVAGFAGLVMYGVNADLRRMLGNVVLGMMLLSALMGLFEAATHIRILPYSLNESEFRPIGLTDHPLTLGMMCASGIAFVALSQWRVWAKVGGILVLFIGAVASGARFSLILATLEIFVLLIFVPWPGLTKMQQFQAKTVVLVITLVAGVVLFTVAAAAGLLNRFSDGVLDENYLARVNVYDVFNYVSWQQVVFGTDIAGILKIVNEKIGLPYIESTPVILIFQLGLPIAIIFSGLVFWIFFRLLKGASRTAWIGIGIFFITALSNNLLSSKTPVIAIFIALLVAFAGPEVPRPRGSTSSP